MIGKFVIRLDLQQALENRLPVQHKAGKHRTQHCARTVPIFLRSNPLAPHNEGHLNRPLLVAKGDERRWRQLVAAADVHPLLREPRLLGSHYHELTQLGV